MNRALTAVAVAAALGVAGCGGSSGGAQPGQSPSASVTASANAAGCSSASPQPKPPGRYQQPKVAIDRTTYTGTITTNCGTIVIALDGKDAPVTVNSFAFLADKHFFDGTFCHRLTTAGIYVLQCGDPTGSGSGGPGYTIPDENLDAIHNKLYPAGTVAMANAGPDTGGSQFFLVYQDSPLAPNYTPFGQIVSGLDVLQKVAAQGTTTGGPDGFPAQPVVIQSFTVTKGAPSASQN